MTKTSDIPPNMALIDGELFPIEHDGMVLVDVFYLPKEDVEQYISDREFYAEKAIEIFAEFSHSAERCWAGSQDGEAVVGLNKDGDVIALIHLDPDGIDLMKEADENGELKAALLRHNLFLER